ncbi:Excinuclease ABC C subunit domain protein [Gloeothece citriformis PCC 7424]|uniref:Excinuclease ABC C subunit domain protein n=1 Tax=Gloeothece citriformis (strain PCC 7424) TaxID=65393 RepID=B7K6Y8_GLOC7|nr:excinuclease ABC subunit C [Gloeothece citriformis]ACK72687.1 Excinuclease ABC C subunit domain protein [Gloeothece citriformis PCC 7424]
MQVDDYILKLPYVDLKKKQLLPEYSGIYYVVDEAGLVWYIGQAKKINERWAGKSHHRLHQLEAQKKKQFRIYYESIAIGCLDEVEKQRIQQYNPHLNGSKVKRKKVHPTETLLRETLVALSDFAFILGIEPPRQNDPLYVQKCIDFRQDWRIRKKVLSLNVIHIGINQAAMGEVVEDWEHKKAFLGNSFKTRKSYANKWESSSDLSFDLAGQRLVVNGYAIEVCNVNKEVTELIKSYHLQTLAGIQLKTLNQESLEILKKKCCQSQGTLYIPEKFSGGIVELNHQSLQRIRQYETDPIKLVFNEPINEKGGKFLLKQIAEEYQTGKRGIGSRSNKIDISSLLTARGIDKTRYINLSYSSTPQRGRLYIYVKCFAGDLREPLGKQRINLGTDQGSQNNSLPISNLIRGSKGIKAQSLNSYNLSYNNIYMRATVDREAWLLFETYLSDFAKIELSQDDGYIEKVYISGKKYIVPAKLSLTIDNHRSITIPFGPKDEMNYEKVIQVIRERLQNSGLPNLKISFTRETIKK